MLEKTVRLAVDVTIHEGQLEGFRKVAAEMVAASESEPGTLGYEFFFSSDDKRCRLLEAYADSAAILAHFKGLAVTQLVPKMMPLCHVDRFEIYGDPGPEVTAMAGGLGAKFFAYWKGLSR
jgi:quinol monooxygenase YgiN